MTSNTKAFLAGAGFGAVVTLLICLALWGAFGPQRSVAGEGIVELPKVEPAVVEPRATEPERPTATEPEQSKAIERSLQSDLQTLRSQVELYKVQHLGQAPTQERYIDQLTCKTNQHGDAMLPNTADGEHPFGPYLRRFPANPFIADTDRAAQIAFGRGPSPGDGSSGWYVNLDDDSIHPNDSQHKGW